MSDRGIGATSPPSVAQLRAFLAIVAEGHFGRAAARAGVSQPTLSHHLSALETRLGVQLVERSTRGVLVTAAGHRLVPYADAAVKAVGAVVTAMAPEHEWLGGAMGLGLIPTSAPYVLPAFLKAFSREAPDLALTVREDQTGRLIPSVLAADLDMALLALPVKERGLSSIRVFHEDFVLVAPMGDPAAGSDSLEVADLADRPLLLLDEGHCLRDQALELCREAGSGSPIVESARTSSLTTVVELVAAGYGASLLPATAVAVETRRARVATARFRAPAPGRTMGLVFRDSDRRREEFEDVAEILRRACTRARLAAVPVSDPPGG
ncbi:MAG: hydrogen peroxide-inducible genes activator [Candidatus Nanopelagicales bacterium]|nr:hydrogen peroxide-inducible genes activator [Candidatus Nanopelagicales bacterium]